MPYRINKALQLNQDIKKQALKLLDHFGIVDKKTRNIYSLSHGEQQRVAICRALITQPDLIIADEATETLDPKNRQHTLNELQSYIKNNKATLIAVTHDHTSLDMFDRVIDFDQNNYGNQK